MSVNIETGSSLGCARLEPLFEPTKHVCDADDLAKMAMNDGWRGNSLRRNCRRSSCLSTQELNYDPQLPFVFSLSRGEQVYVGYLVALGIYRNVLFRQHI